MESSGQSTINSIKDIGFYSKEGNINLLGNYIRLGDLSAKQSLVLGDEFIRSSILLIFISSQLFSKELMRQQKISLFKFQY